MKTAKRPLPNFLLLVPVVILFFCASPVAFGQFGAPSNENLSFILSPELPRSNQNVTVSLDVLGIELTRSLITWSIDNQTIKEGIGEKTITFKTGSLGSSKTVSVSILTLDGRTFRQSIDVRPADVNIVWESNTYVPPFYKGRAAYTYQSSIRAVAFPEIYDSNGRKLDTDELVFYWKDDTKVLGSQSGVGKNSATIKPAIPLKSTTISLEVASFLNPLLAAETRLVLPPRLPTVILYEDNPLYGVLYNKALSGNLPIKGEELTVRAEPYFFDTNNPLANSISYLWLLNGASVGEDTGLNSLTFRKTSTLSGLASISVTAKNLSAIFQSGSGAFSLSFDESTATNQ